MVPFGIQCLVDYRGGFTRVSQRDDEVLRWELVASPASLRDCVTAYRIAGSILVFGSEVSTLETAGQLGMVRSENNWRCIPRAPALLGPGSRLCDQPGHPSSSWDSWLDCCSGYRPST